MAHDFGAALTFSLQPELRAGLMKVYEQLFGADLRTISLVYDRARQQQGIDVEVELEGGARGITRRTVQEKVRRRGVLARFGRDLTIETESNVERGTPGWIVTAAADILVYAYEEEVSAADPRAYVFDFAALRAWFARSRTELLRRYRLQQTTSRAGRVAWTTRFISVPMHDIPDPIWLTGPPAAAQP